MKAEIVAVGTELLLGQIVNTNAQYLAEELAGLGVNVYFQTVVGDNAGRIRDALSIARGRADLVICTGGLGPTQDDLTKDVVADFAGVPLLMHDLTLTRIEDFFRARGIPMVDSNRRQATLPEGADPLLNDAGMAVGAALTHEGTLYMLLPGPPKELKPMFETYGKPWIRGKLGDEAPLFSRMLKFAGIGESMLEHQLIDLIEAQQDPSIAPYAKEGEVTIRLTTRARTAEQAEGKLSKAEEEIRARVGQYLYASENVSMEQVVLGLLRSRGATLGFAESCTGGMLSEMVTAVPGSSDAFRGGIVCYTNAVKHHALGVPMEVLEGEGAPGAVSGETARLLADGAVRSLGADYGVSVTGVAGPASSEGKPVGLVYVGIAAPHQETKTFKLELSGSRETIRLKACRAALYRLWRELIG